VVGLVGKIERLARKIVNKFPGTFCSAGSSSVPEEIAETLDDALHDLCDQMKDDAAEVQPDGTIKYRDRDGNLQDTWDMDECIEREIERVGPIEETGGPKFEDAKPFKVWSYAQNGNVIMQSLSFVDKTPEMLARDDRALEIADRGATGHLRQLDSDDVEWIRAQAEFYFDCSGAWDGCSADAMWTIGWTARLRRVRSLPQMLFDAGEIFLPDLLADNVEETIGRIEHPTEGRPLTAVDILNWTESVLIRGRSSVIH